MKFKAGMRVEACSWERGFEGAWFEGVILSCKRDYCEVLFEKFKNEDGDQALVEKTNYNKLRPRPPRTNVGNWAIGDLVEANENDAWWRGVVMQVLPAQQYFVKFPETDSENVFHQFNMRGRQDWGNGKWYLPLPSPLQATRIKIFPAKFPVGKGLLFEESRKDIDNKKCYLYIDGSCTAFVNSSIDRNINMRDERDRTDHATRYSSTDDHNQKKNGIDLADEITHEIEVNAYRSVLKVFYARKSFSWTTELLLTDLRVELHITSGGHLLELEKLKFASEIKMYTS